MECIILAGGLGTRLRGVIGEQPKCMAPVNGRPFLHYLLQYLTTQGCTRVILSLGYRHEVVTEWLQHQTFPFPVDHITEPEPLGTGGGIQRALTMAAEDFVFVLNGDTFFDVNLRHLQDCLTTAAPAETVLALKAMTHFERYGTVTLAPDHSVTAFHEKMPRENGLINGGIYLINRPAFLNRQLPDKYSFEKDYLEAFLHEKVFFGVEDKSYFIDIGVPEDYEQAQQDFKVLF